MLFSPYGFAQPVLQPSIGLSALPADTDSVSAIPWYLGSFYSSGIAPGDTAADFKLYSLSGDSIVLSEWLTSGKPVLLIAGSYTCPVFRNKVGSINNVVNLYGSQVNVAIIYTLEAHPEIDTSVYFGYVQTGNHNINAGILYRQPVTYGQRKDILSDMLNDINIQAPVFIDGPENNWWNFYGPAPNNAYLIDTNGLVFSKHGWYDKFPDDIICDLDSLLGNPVNCAPIPAGGSFTFNMISNDTVYSSAGSIITIEGELENTSAFDVLVDIKRSVNVMPPGWASSLCIDVCYSTATDSVSILLPACDIRPFYFYVYTTGTIDTSRSRVNFRNNANTNIQFSQNMFGITTFTTNLDFVNNNPVPFQLYPNPAKETATLIFESVKPEETNVEIYDLTGRMVLVVNTDRLNSGMTTLQFNVSSLTSGIYLVAIKNKSGSVHTGKLVIQN